MFSLRIEFSLSTHHGRLCVRHLSDSARARPSSPVTSSISGSVADADLIFARFLLTHLSDPASAIERWAARLAPRGLLAVEEVESIRTDEPVLATYLDLQRRILAANRNVLEVGALIQGPLDDVGASCAVRW